MMEKNTEWEMSCCSCFQTCNSQRSQFGRRDATPDCHEELARRTLEVPPIPTPVSRGLTGLLLKDKQGITVVVRVQMPMKRDQMLMHTGSQAAASLSGPRFVLRLEKRGQTGSTVPKTRLQTHRARLAGDRDLLTSRERAAGLRAEDKCLPAKSGGSPDVQERRWCW